jgi:hypothetical protein
MRRLGPPVPPGQYRVVLTVDGKEQVQGLLVERDPTLPATVIAAEEEPAREREERPIDH